MRLLDRYLLRELLVPLGFCLGGFLIFFIAFDLFGHLDDFQKAGMHFGDLVQYYLLTTPESLVVVLPIALLLALLYALTNHARHHEITAIRAAGVSLWRLCLPYLVVGLGGSLLLFFLNEFWVPRSTEAAEQLKTRRLPRPPGAPGRHQMRNLGFTNARDGRMWKIGLYDTDTGVMTNPKVFWSETNSERIWLEADKAEQVDGVWTFSNVREFRETSEANAQPVPILVTNVLAMPTFNETREEIESEIKISDELVLNRAKSAKKSDISILEILHYLRLHPHPARADEFWLHTKLQGRLAAPWKCLVVVLIAIPFGAPSGRRNVFVGVAGSIVICFAFFVLQQLGLALGTGGYLPAWLAAWLPNLSFGFLGLFLASRVR
jgi:lipopolysaccharide export system permease protein